MAIDKHVEAERMQPPYIGKQLLFQCGPVRTLQLHERSHVQREADEIEACRSELARKSFGKGIARRLERA
jgi:hypothetical protein